jgi:hypothetical protein
MTVSVEPAASTRKHMKPRHRGRAWRPLFDAAIAGAVFMLLSATVMCNHARAGIIPAVFGGVQHAAPSSSTSFKAVADASPMPIIHIATASSPGEAVYRQTSITAAWSLLGVAFSIMVALNLAILRHLKRAYAPTRRYPLAK